ncbi:MAG: polymerase sigma-70 factor [Gemmatimonadetes bacterium]|nr:polymerase sigma-70 factor [Gemmatimonadota bacterium]
MPGPVSVGRGMDARNVHIGVDDRELLQRLMGDEPGARDAFDRIFRLWYERVVRMATAILREQAVAEEVVQDVMLELWRRRQQLDPEGSIQAWLFRSARNRSLNHIRHQKVAREGQVYIDQETTRAPTGPNELVSEEIEVALRDAVASLPPRCQEVFRLSRVDGLKYAEIAERLGISVKAVEAQMTRALRALRERLAQWLPENGSGLGN